MPATAFRGLCAVALALGAAAVDAGQASTSFVVSVQLQSGQSFGGSGPCGSAIGAVGISLGCGPAVVPVAPEAPPVIPPPATVPPVTMPPASVPPGSQPSDTPPNPPSTPPTAAPAAAPQRVLAFVPREAGPVLTPIDLYTGTGTVTAWRVVRYGEREFLEMTLGW